MSKISKVLLVHGWQGSDAPHWQAWLHEQLPMQGIESRFIQFEDNMNPNKTIWLDQIQKSLQEFQPDTVITHSLGAMVWFHLCHSNKAPSIQRLIVVAPPRDLGDITQLESFFPCETPHNCFANEVCLISSSDDKYMTTHESKLMAEVLQAHHIILDKAGHINADSHFGAWPWILEYIVKGNHDT